MTGARVVKAAEARGDRREGGSRKQETLAAKPTADLVRGAVLSCAPAEMSRMYQSPAAHPQTTGGCISHRIQPAPVAFVGLAVSASRAGFGEPGASLRRSPILTVGIGHRFYSPELGRWMSRDPAKNRNMRKYCFCRNSPSLRLDSDGRYDVSIPEPPVYRPPDEDIQPIDPGVPAPSSPCRQALVMLGQSLASIAGTQLKARVQESCPGEDVTCDIGTPTLTDIQEGPVASGGRCVAAIGNWDQDGCVTIRFTKMGTSIKWVCKAMMGFEVACQCPQQDICMEKNADGSYYGSDPTPRETNRFKPQLIDLSAKVYPGKDRTDADQRYTLRLCGASHAEVMRIASDFHQSCTPPAGAKPIGE